jgi:hypothetical protein
MIRIDEIYNNVFVPLVQHQKDNGLHWFDPFGSTDFNDICNVPPIEQGKRWVFWDQEPIHQDRATQFFEQFLPVYGDNSEVVVVTSEYHSEDVQWLSDTYNLQSAYYFFHGWAALDWYRGYNRTFLHQPKNISHTFLCLNNIVGGKRQHRLALLNELAKRDLVNTNLISFPATCPYEGISVKDHIDYDLPLPLTIDEFDNHSNNSHQITMWKQAASSLLQVVTETSYYGNKNHLTEKTFKPVVLKQPFILASNRGSLEYLRRYGFETFSSVWDESYDLLPDAGRTVAIADLLEELEHADWASIQKQCEPIVQHNYDWFYSGKFEQVLWDELLGMIHTW